ncbi:MAG TPA: isochorismatase family protein, partial [Anaerolineae bacterium]|nr:isochorismatase family protein [Anaerolineae bacterium]
HDGGPNDPLEPSTPGWPIHPTIAPAADELIVRKRTPDAFHETTLQQELNSRGIRKLVLAGLQTEYCVDTTCRRAFSLGYQVALAQDAHSTWNTDTLTAAQIIAHHNTVLGDWFATLRLTDEIDFQAL